MDDQENQNAPQQEGHLQQDEPEPYNWLLLYQLSDISNRADAAVSLIRSTTYIYSRFLKEPAKTKWKLCSQEKFDEIHGIKIIDTLVEESAGITGKEKEQCDKAIKNLNDLKLFWEIKVNETQAHNNSINIKTYFWSPSDGKIIKKVLQVNLPEEPDELTKIICYTKAALGQIVSLCVNLQNVVVSQNFVQDEGQVDFVDTNLEEYQFSDDENEDGVVN